MRHVTILSALVLVACSSTSGTAWSLSPQWDGRSGPWSVEVIDASGASLPTYEARGRTWILGERDQRYRIRVRNHSSRRVEAVVSVDGRDAVDGREASWNKPGYVIDPWGAVTIDGYRMSLSEVATFRFSPVARSYAALTGDARDVGVIGVAVFPERIRHRRRPRPVQRPRPSDDAREADAPHWTDRGREHGDADEEYGDGAAAEARKAPARSRPSAGAAGRDSAAAAPRSESGRGSMDRSRRQPSERPGLGTAFGERRSSSAHEVDFVRANRYRPAVVLGLGYNNRRGLAAMGIDVDGCRHRPARHRCRRDWDRHQRETARPFAEVPRQFAAPPPGW